MDKGAWQATIYRVAKSQDTTEQLTHKSKKKKKNYQAIKHMEETLMCITN